MKKILIVFIFCCIQTVLGFSQTVTYVVNYKHKVYSTSPNGDKNLKARFYIMSKVYIYSKRFYSLNKLPNIYTINFFTVKVPPTISFDIVQGWILSREGEEMNSESGKCGLRIECNTGIDSTLRLLDYGINNIKHIQAFKDSILSLPEGVDRPFFPNIPNNEIEKALTLKLNHRKEIFIRMAVEKYNKEFKNNLEKGISPNY